MMNCKRVEQLMPLHAGDDLENEREREAFAAHLGGCDSCRRLAAEWEESRSLITLHEPPDFDDAFFTSIRRSVMHEITATPAPSGFVSLFAPLLQTRTLAYTATCALILAAVVFGLLFSQVDKTPKLSASGDGIFAIVNTNSSYKEDSARNAPRKSFNLKDKHEFSKERKSVGRRNRGGVRLANNRTPQTLAPSLSPDGATPNRVAASDGTPQPNDAIADERKMLRIEMQTHDPNVRIIWFSPQPANERQSPRSSHHNR